MLREIEPEEIKKVLTQPRNFGYSGDRDLFGTWGLGPVLDTRDSGLVAESNAHSIKESLTELEASGEVEKDSWEIIGISHWGWGYGDQLIFQALDEEGEPTRVFSHLMSMVDAINEYVVLDSSDHSRREYEAQLESIENNAPYLKDNLPEDWTNQVFKWLLSNLQEESFYGDDRTSIPEECVEEACGALGFAEEEE